MSERWRVGVLFGGASVEHEVSVVSARGVLQAFDPGRFECLPIGVTVKGEWLSPESSAAQLARGSPRVEAEGEERVVVLPGRGLARCRRGRVEPLAVDVVFPLVHGWGGEDGRVQGLLELAELPYVGAGVAGSALGMDKALSKALFERYGLPVAPWRMLREADWRADPTGHAERIGRALGYPLFVKPANGGSSVGVCKVREASALPEAVAQALACDRKVVFEAALDAREIECAVLGNDTPQASVPGEIVPSREFYDYEAKYVDGTSELRIPAPLPEAVGARVRELACRAFEVLDLAGMARVDFFLGRRDERVWINEVNTLPGFTPVSMFAKLWEASGIAYPELLERLVALALERGAAARGRARRRPVERSPGA